MNRNSIARIITFILLIALSSTYICVTVPAMRAAPARPVWNSKPATTPDVTPEEEAAEEAVTEEDELADGEVYPSEEEYDPSVEPDEEIQFIDDIIAEAEIGEDALAAIDGRVNILLIGLDARPNQKNGRSDTMIVMSLDAEHKSIKMISLMRDLYVEIPGRKNNRLNSAYYNGGADLLIKTIEKNFGIPIDHYVAVDFSALASVIDQIGGLTLTVDPKYVPRINAVIKQDNIVLKLPQKDGYLKEGGEQLLTGKQAQAYARYRYGTKDGDFGRTVRQREVIIKALAKVKDLPMTQLVKLALSNIDRIATDMSIPDMIKLAPAVFELQENNIEEMRIPIDKGYESKTISGMSVLVPDRTKTKKAIANFLTK